MNATKNDVQGMDVFEAATRLVDCAILNPAATETDHLYHALVRRYESDSELQRLTHVVAGAKDIRILSCMSPFGMIYVAEKGCRFAANLSSIPTWNNGGSDTIRAAIGAAIPYIAACFYPEADMLEDDTHVPPPQSRLLMCRSFADTCRRLEAAPGTFEALEETPVWRSLLGVLESAPPTADQKKRVRKASTLEDVFIVATNLMVHWGFLKKFPSEDDRFIPTRRFASVLRDGVLPTYYGLAVAHLGAKETLA